MVDSHAKIEYLSEARPIWFKAVVCFEHIVFINCKMATVKAFLDQNVVFLTWNVSVKDQICQQPMITSGAPRLWFFSAGLDATKDPHNKNSMWRMRSHPDEEHLMTATDCMQVIMTEADTCIIVCGRNKLVQKDAKKMFAGVKPKLAVREMDMLPDESVVEAHMRIDSTPVGSVDLQDPYLQILKNKRVQASRKGVPRRFVPGNTAFRTMAGVPVLSKDQLTKVAFSDRELVFKHVHGSDKYCPGVKNKGLGSDSDEPLPEDEGDMDAVGTRQMVPFFPMELHPRVPLA